MRLRSLADAKQARIIIMSILDSLFSRNAGPSAFRLRRALKHATETHGDPATRVAALDRLAGWGTPEAIAALLRRFTIQVPQGSMDLEEKQYTVRLLAQMGKPAVEPILRYLHSQGEVTWPVRALREILPPEEFHAALKNVLDRLGSGYTRWPEAKTVFIAHLPDEAFPMMRETVLRILEDENDDVCIAAADYLARNGDDEVREHLIEAFLNSESRPRVRGRILDHFCDREWPVKGYRKKVEEAIPEPFYLTSRGTVKRRSV